MEHQHNSNQNERISSPSLQFNKIAFLYDELMLGVPYRQWLDYIERMLDKFRMEPANVLDLCCGTGTISRLIAKEKDWEVVGVDISSEMIEIARHRSEESGLGITYHVQDAAKLHVGRKFDLVISLFDSLNYITEAPDLQNAFYRVYEHLNPGGLFIFDMNTELALASGLFNQSNLGSHRAPVHYKWQSSYNQLAKICRINMDFIYRNNGSDERIEVVHYQRAYDVIEVVEMLVNAHLQVHAVYDAYSFADASSRSDRVFYVCRK